MNYNSFFANLPQPVLPVVTISDDDAVKPMIDALVEGGCKVLEITLRTPSGLKAIQYARKTYTDSIVGAGSVLTQADWARVEEAGGQFVISPGATESLYDIAAQSEMPWLPGVSNASDLMRAVEAGLDQVKFFPAMTLGGLPALKNYASVFPQISFCPTGGIKPNDVQTWLLEPMVFAVGGSWFTPQHLVESRDWHGLKRHVTQFWSDFKAFAPVASV